MAPTINSLGEKVRIVISFTIRSHYIESNDNNHIQQTGKEKELYAIRNRCKYKKTYYTGVCMFAYISVKMYSVEYNALSVDKNTMTLTVTTAI